MTEYTKRATSAKSIESARAFIAQDDFEENELHNLKAILTNLKNNWEKFNASNERIIDAAKGLGEVEKHLNFYSESEQQYLEAKAALLKRIRDLKRIEKENRSNKELRENFDAHEQRIKERDPSIVSSNVDRLNQIPQQAQMNQWHNSNFKSIENTWGEFDGNLIQWQGFHDRFKAAIHENEQLSGAYKFMYLQKSLKGKASYALGEWQLTDNNYAEAWERLYQLYERQYETSAALMRKFHGLPKLDHANGAILQKFSNVTHEVLRQLRALEYPVDHYDLFMVHGIH